MTQPGVEVDPAILERVAGDVELLREDFDRVAKEVGPAAEEVGRRLAGWRLARTAGETAFAWQDDAKLAGGWLEEYAAALERCAQDYRYQEGVTAEALALFPRVDGW